MLNQVVLVGRLVWDLKVNKTESGKKVTTLRLAIPRSYKNVDGNYETDFVDCVLWDNIASNTANYCKKGDIVGIKGRIQSRSLDDENKNHELEVVAEKVTFLSSRSGEEKEKKEKKNNKV